MNTPSSPVTECASKLDHFARENPTRAILVAIGCGLAAGILIRALQTRPMESRAARLLADIQDRLHDIAAPAHRRAERFVESGASTAREGVAQFNDLHLDRGLRNLARRIRSLFH